MQQLVYMPPTVKTTIINLAFNIFPYPERYRINTLVTFLVAGDWSRAASHLKRSIVAIKAQYGEDCVELGRQFFKLAQLHFNG